MELPEQLQVDEVDQVFGARMRRRREQLGMSTRALAEKMRENFTWSHSTVSLVEVGKRPAKLAEALALAALLETNLPWLLRPMPNPEETMEKISELEEVLASFETTRTALEQKRAEAKRRQYEAELQYRHAADVGARVAQERRHLEDELERLDERQEILRRHRAALEEMLKLDLRVAEENAATPAADRAALPAEHSETS